MSRGAEAMALIVIAFCLVFGAGYLLGRTAGEQAAHSTPDPWRGVPNNERE